MNNWIKCSERLPDRADLYLVWRESSDIGWIMPGYNITTREYEGNGKWQSCANVTHWQPRPEPPEVEK
jgi:hypothetical protein